MLGGSEIKEDGSNVGGWYRTLVRTPNYPTKQDLPLSSRVDGPFCIALLRKQWASNSASVDVDLLHRSTTKVEIW